MSNKQIVLDEIKKMKYPFRAKEIIRATKKKCKPQTVYVVLSDMKQKGTLKKCREFYQPLGSTELAIKQNNVDVSLLSDKNKKFIELFYKAKGYQTPEGFLNKIVDDYKETLLEPLL